MSASSQMLSDLLAPVDCDTFFCEHWEQKPLTVSRDDPERYAGVLTRRDVDQIIAYTRPRFHDLSAFDGPPSGRPTYVRGVLAGQPSGPQFEPGLADLRAVYDQGRSVVIMSMHHRWPAIAALCRGLEAVFHCPVHANLYLTPPGSQGFAAHYDPHEVFALQLEGVKHWRLYERVEPFPLADTVRIPKPPLGQSREVCLRAGDLLYIPRGHVHDAYTKDAASLHLTVGVNVYRWADLLHQAVDCAARQNVKLRETVPGGALPADWVQLVPRFRELLAGLATEPEIEALLDQALHELGTRFFGELKMLPGSQFSATGIEQVTLDTVLERSPLAVCRLVTNNESVAIEFAGNRVGGPARIAAAFRFIAATERFAVHELPDELTAQSKIKLAQRFVREGLLTIVAQANPLIPPATVTPPSAINSEATLDDTEFDDELGASAPRGTHRSLAIPR